MPERIELISKIGNWIDKINNDSNDDKKWIVFWKNDYRIGSIELNESNWIEIKKTFIYNIIQTDVTGTTHINVIGLIV